MKKLNRKGFTVIESLMVSVILVVIILICGFVVVNSLNSAHKDTFKREVIRGIQAASTAYQIDLLNKEISSGAKVCYSMEWLKNNNIFLKEKDADAYKGSVLVESDKDGKNINYHIWLENDKYIIFNGSLANLTLNGKNNEDGAILEKNNQSASLNCMNSEGMILRK